MSLFSLRLSNEATHRLENAVKNGRKLTVEMQDNPFTCDCRLVLFIFEMLYLYSLFSYH